MITGREHPQVTKKVLFVFCGDHGVTAEGVSAYPREVTAQMVVNFLHGGAAISVLACQFGIDVSIVAVGVDVDFSPEQSEHPAPSRLINRKIGRGTENFTHRPAMTQEAAVRAIEVGISLTTESIHNGAQLIGAGEMRIGNTTSATALLCFLSGLSPEELTGAGTGIHEEARQKKIAVLRTVGENSSDGVLAPLFYLARGGVPLALAYKAINTLDSMLGYRNERYEYFGKAAARLDDSVNFLPARLTALAIIAAAWLLRWCGREYDGSVARRITWRDGHKHASPNAGYPEAALAGVLGVQFGGPGRYFGRAIDKPTLGEPSLTMPSALISQSLILIDGASVVSVSICVAFLLLF